MFASEDVGIEIEDWNEIPRLVTDTQNEELIKEITMEEVKRAVFEINPSKCPGSDGMSGYFYQQFWETIGEEVTAMVQNFFNNGELEEGINRTNICLIPKTLNATSLKEYRPISLCNVAMKIITKILAKRLKRVLPTVISETQAAFV